MVLEKIDYHPFFYPKSIAIVGVSRKDYRFGGLSYLSKLQECRFPGKLYPINPKAGEISGFKVYPDLSSLPEIPDLAIVSLTAEKVPTILEECALIGLRHIHILSSGFKEIGTEEGKRLEEQIASISRKKSLLVIGPNCMGPYCPASGLTAWGAIPGQSGPLGIISQSGGLTQRLTEYVCSLGIGVDKAISFGNAAVLDSSDYLRFMAEDEGVQVIAMYLEGVPDAKNFLPLAREVNREKPVILWKGGETEGGAITAASHTGAIASDQRLWDAFFHQTGVVRVRSMDEWVDAIIALCLLPAPNGKGIFLIGGGGGNSVAHCDTCIREGLNVPALSKATMDRLYQSVPAVGSIAGNPLDMWRTFLDSAYLAEILELAYRDPFVGMIIVDRLIQRKAYHIPELPDQTAEIIEFVKRSMHQKATVFTVDSDGGDPDLATKGAELRARLCRSGIPAYPSLKRAARALVHLHSYHRSFKDNKAVSENSKILS
jgi:acyl-CoA synthetase (NDP forming)